MTNPFIDWYATWYECIFRKIIFSLQQKRVYKETFKNNILNLMQNFDFWKKNSNTLI